MALMNLNNQCYSEITGPTSGTINIGTNSSNIIGAKPINSGSTYINFDKTGYKNISITRTKSEEPLINYIGVSTLYKSSQLIGNTARYYIGEYNLPLTLDNFNAGKFLCYNDIIKVKASFDNSIGGHFSGNPTVTQITKESQATSTGIGYQLGSVGSTYTIIRNYKVTYPFYSDFPPLVKDITIAGFYAATPFAFSSDFTMSIQYTNSWGGTQTQQGNIPRQGYGNLDSFICRGHSNTIRISASASIDNTATIIIADGSSSIEISPTQLPYTYTCGINDISINIQAH